ncbi:MAG: TolC family protein [Prevotella sp.]|nr:TolC family protein [Prevotella sp.]
MQKLRFILSLVFLPTAMGLWAQDREMSLNDCLVYARDHAFANRSNRLAVEQTKMDKRIQAASMLPSIGFSTGGDLSFGRGVDPETNTYDTKKTFNNGYSLSMQLPLFDGLVSLNNYRAARMAELIQGKSAENEADKISLAVIKAYYNIMYYSALVEQMESQLASDRHNLAVTERQEQLGTKSGADVDEMKAMVASDEYELLNQQNLRRKAMIELKAQMGMPVNEELRIEQSTKSMKNEESFLSEEVRVKSEESICAIDVSAGNSTLTKDSSFFILHS